MASSDVTITLDMSDLAPLMEALRETQDAFQSIFARLDQLEVRVNGLDTGIRDEAEWADTVEQRLGSHNRRLHALENLPGVQEVLGTPAEDERVREHQQASSS